MIKNVLLEEGGNRGGGVSTSPTNGTPIPGMSGSYTDVQILLREIRGLRKEVSEMRAVIARDKIFDTWIDEETAAAMVGLKARQLRRKVKDGRININWRATNGRNFQYNRRDLKKFLNDTSTEY